MPGALRTNSWEDHVTPHSRKQYSYDDLDLVCCHTGVESSDSPTGRRRRERCASMPECCRHRPGSESWNRRRKTLSGTFKEIAANHEAQNSQTFTKGQTFVMVRKAMADEDITQSKDGPSSHNHSPSNSNYHLHAIHNKDEEITSETMSGCSGMSSANAFEEQDKNRDFPTTAEIEDVTKDTSFSEVVSNNDMTLGLTGMAETHSEPLIEGNAGDPVVETQHQQVLRVDVEDTITVRDKLNPDVSLVSYEKVDGILKADLTTDTESKQSAASHVVPDIMVNIPNSNNDQVEVPQVSNLNASTELESPSSGSGTNPEKCRDSHSKLDTIPEVSFTELGEEAVNLTMKHESGTTLVDPKGPENSNSSSIILEGQDGGPDAGVMGNFQNIIAGVLEDFVSSSGSKREAFNHVMIPQTSPNAEDVQRDPKLQEVPVRLRTRKVRYTS